MARPTINQIANLQTQLTTTNDSANNRVLKAGDTMTGNLTFSGTGLRILGDMSNATIGNRLAFQTSITNGNSDLNIIPNGTSVTSGIRLNNNSDTTNAGYVRMSLNSTEASISADRNSVSGTYLPLGFNTGGSERMRIDTSGRICIATTTGRTPLSVAQFTNGTPALGNTSFYSASFMDTFASYGLGVHVSSATGIAVLQSQRFDGTATAYDIALNPYGGNVGIGTASPTDKFQIEGTGTVPVASIRSTTTGSVNQAAFNLFRGDSTNGFAQFGVGTTSTNTWQFGLRSGSTSWQLFDVGANASRVVVDTSGNVGIGGTAPAFAKMLIGGTLPAGSANSQGIRMLAMIPSGATSAHSSFLSAVSTEAASFTLTNLFHFNAEPQSFGAGSAVTNQYGFYVASSLTGATNNYGFYSNIASGSNRWNFYAAGTAANYFAGNVGIGTTSPSNKLEVSGTARATFFYALAAGTDDSANFGNSQSNIRIGGDGATMRMNASPWSLTLIAPSVIVSGALSKSSGSFKIDHPLPEKSNTHYLVHSFIEGPQADLIYSGKIQLENGVANINIDAHSKMTEGTFVLLCRDIRCFTTNESDWNAVRGSVTGNILTIECQNISSNATVSWIVIGERQDKHMLDTNWTDDAGKVIVEPEKT